MKIKDTFFIFTNNFIEQHVHHLVPLPSATLQTTSSFHLPKTFYLFEQRIVPGAFCSLPGNWIFFPLREFCKHWNKWKCEGAMSGEYSGWIRTSQPSSNCLYRVIKQTWSSVILMGDCAVSVDQFQTLPQVLLSVGLIGSSTWNSLCSFPAGARNRGLPSDPTTYTQHLLWMKTGLWCGWWSFRLPHDPFHSTLL